MKRLGIFSGGAPRPAAPKQAQKYQARRQACATASLLVIAAWLGSCQSMPLPAPPPPRPAPLPMAFEAPPPLSPPPAAPMEQPNYYRLRNTPLGMTPTRVALLLPLSSPSPENRAVAEALESAAELAVFDAKSGDILLMPRDDGGTPEQAAAAAAKAIDDGAEIII